MDGLHTDGTTMIDLAGYLLALYVAVCLGFVGFGMMLGGKAWAQQVARFFFVRPLAGLAAAVRYGAFRRDLAHGVAAHRPLALARTALAPPEPPARHHRGGHRAVRAHGCGLCRRLAGAVDERNLPGQAGAEANVARPFLMFDTLSLVRTTLWFRTYCC